jgi:signal transduction histidine kinase
MVQAGTNPISLGRSWAANAALVLSILVATAEIVIDWGTWVELNVSIVYGLPLVLAAVARQRRLLWGLMAVLIVMTFAVYAAQIPAGQFTVIEPLFVNRVLAALALVITTCLLHVRLIASEKLAAQDEALKEQNQALEQANVELVLREAEIERQNEELERRRREAEEASARKTRFMASVSHDIRTPVNAISLMAEVMCRTADNPAFAAELPDIARRLKSNALSLVDLLSEVLDIACFDSGQIELKSTRVSLNQLLDEQCRALLPLAQAKGLTLRLHSAPEPIWVHIDRVKLSRVVVNLLTNAIKYTEQGGVTATIEAISGGAVSVVVQDTGVGIPPDWLDRIFDEYAQLTNPDRDPNKGWGLGLPICKRLIQMLGGAISVTSQVGKGTTFTVRLPSECLCESSGVTIVEDADRSNPAERRADSVSAADDS